MDAMHPSPFNTLLAKLDGVKLHGQGHRARCPACGGTSAKMSIAEAANGAVLLHCFAGCAPVDVLAAVGLRLSDLYKERLRPMTDAERRDTRDRTLMAQWMAALEVLCKEVAIVSLAQRQLVGGQVLNRDDDARLKVAEERIAGARNVLCRQPIRFRPEVKV